MKANQFMVALALIAISPMVLAQNHSQAEFEQRYGAFQQALNEQAESEQLIKLAKQSYEAGEKYFGEDNINTANLKMSYLNLVPINTLRSKESQQLAYSVVDVYRDHYNEHAPELIPALQQVLNTHSEPSDLRAIKRIFNDVVEVADANMASQPEAMMRAKLSAGAQMLRLRSRSSRELVEFAEEAAERFGREHELTLLADFHAARYLEVSGDVNQAVVNFKKLANHPQLPKSLQYQKFISHARLVNYLEQEGKSDEATAHCIAISKAGYGIGDERSPLALYRVNPEYPESLINLQRDGKITLKFNINASGMVENVSVVETSSEALVKASIAAVKQWRFAPLMIDGQPTVAEGRWIQFDYSLN